MYRLKETSSGSPLHDIVADQDVIVTPGATAHLTIADPFKAAQVSLKAKDDKTGKLLPGSTVNIGSGDKTLLTLTTGPKGTASGELPVSGRKTEFWVKQIADSATPGADSLLVPAVAATEEATLKNPDGSLAHTGADATPALLGGAGLLIATGGGALVAARRRRTHESDKGRPIER